MRIQLFPRSVTHMEKQGAKESIETRVLMHKYACMHVCVFSGSNVCAYVLLHQLISIAVPLSGARQALSARPHDLGELHFVLGSCPRRFVD